MKESWPDMVECFNIFPKRVVDAEDDFNCTRECDLPGLSCNCDYPKDGNLIEYLFNHSMCEKHIPHNLLVTPGKIIIDSCDTRIIDFLQSPKNYKVLDLIADIERSAFLLPHLADHILVIHKLYFTKGPGWYRDSIVLNTKVEFQKYSVGKEIVQLAYDIGDVASLDLSVQRYLENCQFEMKAALTKLHAKRNITKVVSRKRSNSI